jgi:hypothetical protein
MVKTKWPNEVTSVKLVAFQLVYFQKESPTFQRLPLYDDRRYASELTLSESIPGLASNMTPWRISVWSPI